MSKVFVIQRNDGRMDLRPAEGFGEIRFVVPKEISVFRTDALIAEIDAGLQGFNQDSDYIIPVGNPTIIGMVFAILGQESETINVLHWTARERQYVPLKFSLCSP